MQITIKTERELRKALKETRKALELTGAAEQDAYKTAYQKDAMTAQTEGRIFHLGCTGTELEKHERLWEIKTRRLKAVVQTLEWALGQGELPVW